MIDETSGIIGWPIGQQYKELAVRDEASTTTWETLVEQYRERAKRDDARIDELRQSTEHWHDTAQMLKRQRDTAEEERDGWKERALKAEQWRQVDRDMITIAEGQRDQAKQQAEAIGDNWQRTYDHDCKKLIAEADHWKGEWAVVMGQLGGARAEVEALRKYAAQWYEHITLKAAIDAALAVQPTTGDKHE